MNILLLGSGGREHALAWKIFQSPLCNNLFIAPGNAGTEKCGKNINISVTDFEAIKTSCLNNEINMLVVGPEEPLVNGIYDFFADDDELKHIAVIGPSKQGAQLEGSKAFAKKFMQRNGIPTAGYKEFSAENYLDGVAYIKQHSLPIVLKADGLAAGKGVVICTSTEEAIQVFDEMILQHKFGKAGNQVVVEEFLSGIELSAFILTDGKSYFLLPEAKDYKRIGEGDTGLNTGGMGAVSPVPFADESFMNKVKQKIIEPTINGLAKENIIYYGFVFIGLIKVGDEPFVIEYNCRMGDPETEVVMLRLKNDLVKLFLSTADGNLIHEKIEIEKRTAATIVVVSKGYPGEYQKNKQITLPLMIDNDTIIFHMGTKQLYDKLISNGGRVIAVSSYGKNIQDAVAKSKQCLQEINFEGMYYRNDIGYEFEK